MQVSAINFTGRRDNIDAFINLDDAVIRQSAVLKTLDSIDTQKHRRLEKALTYALPLAGGLALASKLPRGNRGIGFVKGMLDWGFFLTGAGVASKAMSALRDKVDAVKDFSDKHRVFSFVGSIAIAAAAGFGLIHGGFKACDKILDSKTFNNLAKNISGKVSKSKIVNSVSEYGAKVVKGLSNKVYKLPSSLKETLKFVANYSPLALIIGSFVHSANHAAVVNSTFAKNFSDMKEKQLELARQRNNELALQNDFFLTDAKNREDLVLLKNPEKDINV